MANKVYKDAKSALDGLLRDNLMLMCGGFGLVGVPDKLIEAVRNSGVKGLTCVSNNAGIDGAGLGLLLETGQVKRMISSYVGENKTFAKLYLEGKLEIEFNPQGTLAERCRADAAGNLVYRKAARNFNPMMATAAKMCIAEVEELVPVGALDPDHVHTPGIFVKRIFCGAPYDKKIEQRAIRKA